MGEVGQHVSNTKEGVSFSDAAKAHILSYLSAQNGSQGLRLSVKKTGCSGLSYVVETAFELNDTDLCFAFPEAGYTVYVDKKSYPFLKGVHIDYVKQGLNAKFVFKNPNQSGECGCGESFTVEDALE